MDLVITGGVDDTDIAKLQEIINDGDVLLVWSDLDEMWSDGWVYFIGIIKTFWVLEVRDVQLPNVIASCGSEVCVLSILSDGGKNGYFVLEVGTEAEESFDGPGFSRRIFAERIDNPDLTETNGGCECGRFRISWDELDVLNSITIWNGQSVGDGTSLEVPKADSVGAFDTGRRFQNGKWHNEIRCEDHAFLEIDIEPVWGELGAKDVQGAWKILWPLMNDVVILIGFNQTSG